jgi:tRNA A-37 threonylcarbamoyl transferase component Bud32
MEREIDLLLRISQADLQFPVQIPTLIALIMSEDSDKAILGFLMTYIVDALPLSKCISTLTTPRRAKIYEDLKTTICKLHEHGIFWGDVKPDNILIDSSDDVWIHDFGGGFTESWVSHALRESKAGDLEGLEKIAEILVP